MGTSIRASTSFVGKRDSSVQPFERVCHAVKTKHPKVENNQNKNIREATRRTRPLQRTSTIRVEAHNASPPLS